GVHQRMQLRGALPWDHIDSRVTKKFLIQDLHRGMKNKFSPACEKPFIPRDPSKPVKPLEHAVLVCYDCGLDCDLEAIKQERIATRDSLRDGGVEIPAAFRGEQSESTSAASGAAAPARADVRFVAAPARGDGLATNAYEAASGTRHGETSAGARRDLAPEVHIA